MFLTQVRGWGFQTLWATCREGEGPETCGPWRGSLFWGLFWSGRWAIPTERGATALSLPCAGRHSQLHCSFSRAWLWLSHVLLEVSNVWMLRASLCFWFLILFHWEIFLYWKRNEIIVWHSTSLASIKIILYDILCNFGHILSCKVLFLSPKRIKS